MGTKRPFDEELEEYSLRCPKHLDSGDKLTSFSKTLPSTDTSKEFGIPAGESDDGIFSVLHGKREADDATHKIHYSKGLESDSVNFSSDLAESSMSGEDAGSPEYFGFNFPRQTHGRFENLYSYLLDCPPRKEVPVGPNYQAEIPLWDPEEIKEYSVGSKYLVDGDTELKMIGTCVIPSPDFGLSADDGVGRSGRTDCDCPDEGSVRYVRQHVEEAREKLREMFGHEKFEDLGLCDMGEVVAHAWTEREEQAFHEVVYSNPVSCGKNFWRHLTLMFPSRTKKELVSYYFNVFMLRRRAIQNRSNYMRIDSDVDEWQGDSEGSGGPKKDVATAFPSFVCHGVGLDHEDDFVLENEYNGLDKDDESLHEHGDYDSDQQDESVDKHEEDEDDNCDCNDLSNDGSQRGYAMVVSGKDVAANDCGRVHVSEPQTVKPLVDCKYDGLVSCIDDISGGVFGELHNQDSRPANGCAVTATVCGPADVKVDTQEVKVSNDLRKSLHGNSNGSSDGLVSGYILEPCDAKVWEAAYSVSSTKGVDLLPTHNMIEEIFGSSSWNSKTSNDKSIT